MGKEIWLDAEDEPYCINIFYDVDFHCTCGEYIIFSESKEKVCPKCNSIYKADLRVYRKYIEKNFLGDRL